MKKTYSQLVCEQEPVEAPTTAELTAKELTYKHACEFSKRLREQDAKQKLRIHSNQSNRHREHHQDIDQSDSQNEHQHASEQQRRIDFQLLLNKTTEHVHSPTPTHALLAAACMV